MLKSFKKLLLLSLALGVSGSVVMAQQSKYVWKEVSKENGHGYAYKYVTNDPTSSRFYTLNNGLTVILSPTKKQPQIQTYIAVKAGSKTDPSNHTGLAHYLEHLLFKGTDKFGTKDWAKEKPLLDEIEGLYDQYNSTTDPLKRKAIYHLIDSVSGVASRYAIPNEYDKMMSAIGAQNTNAFTSFEQTVYQEQIPSNVVDQYLAVQAERFRNPIFRLFHTELEAVYEEKNIGLDNDSRKTIEAMFESLFPNNNYGKQTTIGTVEHLKNPSLKAIHKYFNTYYVPNNMGVIMSGDFNPDELIKKIDLAFSYMKPKTVPAYTFEPEKPIQTPIIKEVKGPSAEFMFLGYRFPGASSKDAQMLELIGNILTNGSAGLIDLDLVKAQKLLYAGAFPYILKDYSLLILQGNPTQGQSLEQVKELLLAEIVKLKKGDFDESILTSIVNNEKKSEIKQFDSYNQRASSLMDNFTSGTDWASELNYSDNITKITKKEIVDFANKYLNDNNYVAVFKRKGVDESVVKVEKPVITPVEMNRDDQSPFLQKLIAMPEKSIQPVWVDYNKDVQKGKIADLPVLAVQNKNNELFSLVYRFNVGSWNNKLLSLAANYLDYLGTAKKSSADFSKDFYSLASDFNVSVGNEESSISLSGLNSNFTASVKLMKDLLHNSVANEAAFKSYLEALKKSRANAKADKKNIMEGLKSYAKYGEKNPFNSSLSDDELSKLTAQDLVNVLHQLVNARHTVLYFGPKTVAQLSADLQPLKDAKASYAEFAGKTEFKELPTTENKVLFANFDMKQAEVFWYRTSALFNQELMPTVSLFNDYFGGGMGTIVFQTIRESKALAYSTYSYYMMPSKKENHYSVAAYVGTQADKFKDAVAGMNELLNVLPNSEQGIVTAKTGLMKSIASQRISDFGVLNSYMAAQRLGFSTDYRKNIFEKVPALKFDDLQKFHSEYISQKPYVYCIVAQDDNIKVEDLAKIGKVQKLTLEEIFGY